MKTLIRSPFWLLLILGLGWTGCATIQDALKSKPITLVTVQSYTVPGPATDSDKAFRDVTLALVDRGFDIKASNKDAGLVTSEYQKYASFGNNPPFDYYLQIRAVIRKNTDGTVAVQLSPTVKEQNRANAAAYTEQELAYYTGDNATLQRIGATNDGWWNRGLTTYLNVVHDVCAKMGISVEDADKNITETPYLVTFDDRIVPARVN
ncbi:MAG: hypothetical protein ACE5G0_17055 [Rhodothermales bacterium]